MCFTEAKLISRKMNIFPVLHDGAVLRLLGEGTRRRGGQVLSMTSKDSGGFAEVRRGVSSTLEALAKNEHTKCMTSVERHLPTTGGEEQQ